MPEDISLEGPQRRLNTATATAPEHKAAAPAPEPSAAEPGDNGQGWLLRILLGWHASFTLMGIVLELLLWTDGAPWFAHLVLYGLAAEQCSVPVDQPRRACGGRTFPIDPVMVTE
ncbi:hypothetical protein [Streptomyces sp. NBC_00045]|uniref:hypothetical protein n=1 Tax=Streptomyces sp. NBC_00045 TaxID=2975625 RepID=UPI002F91763E